MKPIPFTLPVSSDHSIVFEEYLGAYFYPHLHRHKEFQLMWVIKGSGTLIVDHNLYRFKSGDMFLIGPNQPHVFKSDSEYFMPDSKLEARGLALFFDPEGSFDSLFNLPELRTIKDFLKDSAGGFLIPEHRAKLLQRKLLELKLAKGAERIGMFLYLIDYVHSIRGEATVLSAKMKSKAYPEVKAGRIQTIYDYVLKNYENDISLDDVAAQACMTPPAFCRYFKKRTGKTFVSFLNELRVNEACKKLVAEQNDTPIANIAADCGFNSVTNFNRVFRTIMGNSPSDYQKQFLSKQDSN